MYKFDRNTRSEAANAMFMKAAAQARDISVLYLLTISKQYQQPVDILGVGVRGVRPPKLRAHKFRDCLPARQHDDADQNTEGTCSNLQEVVT